MKIHSDFENIQTYKYMYNMLKSLQIIQFPLTIWISSQWPLPLY